MSRRGMSTLELVIVVGILGLTAAVAAPRYASAQRSFQIESAARRIAGDLKFARRQAESKSVATTITFNPGADSYDCVNIPDPDRPDKNYQVQLTKTNYVADITSANFGGSASVSFSIHGVPSKTGSVVLQLGSLTKTVSVSSLGEVTITP